MPAAHKPTDEQRAQVLALGECGIPEKKIAAYIGVSYNTLRKYYEEELLTAGLNKVMQVAGALFDNALSGNVTAQIFYLKTRGGWREPENVDDNKEESVNKIQIEVIGDGNLKES